MVSVPLFALVDCNNFYVSCERVFAPKLRDEPVVVLSNNDGCIVARSNEVKALGVKMGSPYFQYRSLIEHRGVQVFSSNYTLYGDMSRRVMSVLAYFSPEVEVYSIDEAFLNLAGFATNTITDYGKKIRATVKQWTGIPVSIGIANTKTLAKVGAYIAKHSSKAGGVVTLLHPRYRERALAMTPVAEVWGIGRRLAPRMMGLGIQTALQLSRANERWIRKQMGVNGVRIVQELRGISCFPMQVARAPKKSITCSRSFGRPVTTLTEMQEAVAAYVSRAAEELREERAVVKELLVFMMTNRFNEKELQYHPHMTVTLPVATSNTGELIHQALQAVEKIFKTGYKYKKAGVIFTELLPENQTQMDMFDTTNRSRLGKLMAVVDRINTRFGSRSLQFAAQGITQPWHMKCDMRSPCYTTDWNQLLTVQA